MNDNCIQFKNDTNWDCTRDELNYTPFNEEGFNPQDFQEYVNKEFKDIHVNDNQLGIQQMFVPRYTNMYHMKDNTFGNFVKFDCPSMKMKIGLSDSGITGDVAVIKKSHFSAVVFPVPILPMKCFD